MNAVAAGRVDDLLRAAAAAVGGTWLAICFLSPRSIGLGDARLAAVFAGALAYSSWADVGQALALAAVLGGVTALILWCSAAAQAPSRWAPRSSSGRCWLSGSERELLCQPPPMYPDRPAETAPTGPDS